MRMNSSLLPALLCLYQGAAAAQTAGIHLEHKDWEVSCDNTRTCRAAGYGDDNLVDKHVSVLLTRRAGPAQAVTAQLQLAHFDDEDVPHAVQMLIDERPFGAVKLNDKTLIGELSPAQTSALLDAIIRDRHPVWTADGEQWLLSTKGANAVLLKMDEFQGRLGTPGALLRKGRKPESSVLPPVPAPRVTAASVGAVPLKKSPLNPQQERSLLSELRHTLKNEDCELLGASGSKLEYAPLSDKLLVVSAQCWRAAYNDGSGYWVINTVAPYSPRFVTNLGTDYGDGEIHSVQKGRGIADCLSTDTWTWDGKAFVHTASGTTGMCRTIAGGGAWELPVIVTDVRRSR